MNNRKKDIRIILLAALAIAFTMMLPRIAIVTYLKENPGPGMDKSTWWNLCTKFIYSFLIAWIFLWINIHRFTIRSFSTFNRSLRLLLNIVLLVIVRYLFKLLHIPEEREAISWKATVLLFNISLVIEVAFCISAAEIYALLVTNQQQKLNNERLLKANAEATFEALKTQVNPHFLFNSLNTINAMIDNDTKAAKKFVTNMSQVYRYLLSSTGKPVITLAEEMDFTKAYISMLLERHSGSLNVNTDIPPYFYKYLLPPVSVQVLVENAVKHNVVSMRFPLTINIIVKESRLVVSNIINEKKQMPGTTGTGLYNLNQRYLHLCNTEIDITRSDGCFKVSIPLLKTFEETGNTANSKIWYNERFDHRG